MPDCTMAKLSSWELMTMNITTQLVTVAFSSAP